MAADSLQHEIEQFLFHEAELIDHRRLDEWAELFVDGAVYAVPNASEDGDPGLGGFIIHEDRKGIAERVRRLQHPAALTQVPPPRTRHLIANVVTREAEDGGDLLVTSNQVVYFARQGREEHYPGSWEHVLTRVGDGWRIKRKKVFLLTNDQPMAQLPVL